MTYGIRIVLGGDQLSVSLGESAAGAATAIDKVSIPWGRESIYDQPDPSQAVVTLLDRTGRYVDDAAITGQRLEVYITGEAAGERRVFRGTVTDPKCVRITLDGDSAYRVTLVAADPTADLGRYIGPGDWYTGQTDFGSTTLGAGAYTMAGGNQRVDWLMNRGTNGPPATDVPRIVTDIETPPGVATGHTNEPGYYLYVGAVEAAGDVSVLDVLREASRLKPMGWVNYDPANDTVRIGQLAPAAALRLALSAGRIVIVPQAPADGSAGALLVDASTIEMPDGYTLTAAPDNAVDRIIIPRLKQVFTTDGQPVSGVQFYKQIMVRTQAWRNTARFDPARFGIRQVDYGLTFGGLENAYGSSPYNYGTDGVGWLIDQVTAYINAYNGSYRLPLLRYQVSRDPAVTDDRTEMLINPRTHGRPIFFAGSVFNGLASVPSQVQLIGGTVGYSNGSWWSEMITAPADSSQLAASTLTVKQLVTNPVPTLADFDPSIRLADFGLITTGLN